MLRSVACRAISSLASRAAYAIRPAPGTVVAQAEPFPIDVVAGKTYSWCTCGHSNKQPLCDGIHKKFNEQLPEEHRRKSLKFVPAQAETLWLCGCKQTATPPYCDGSHVNIDPKFIPAGPWKPKPVEASPAAVSSSSSSSSSSNTASGSLARSSDAAATTPSSPA
ncbi:zinc finger CDGSH-type domain-containing protein [Capsaspora owczarzaki ATCC 30864]|uniref:Zinc finger CDGSH-type domain-containing protein n=1 Tax=Capsaspora owczarzaki (strain ATCC 30864) TaxID=595528 RepID=A0A0D2WM43_CAPO3|nr:zinc finger CDGSH-type domain-containing protein [Capsaspora owczarzaki ATCC 30864]KJE91133.1 zinc finger CDGSH-type domain-containing protein [Capsaspora owczarzaki ATCC 30864]|eukprot:XP_004349064.1 zinc finger CDGSH-type domain-containing protein [Capsaspora owczarzaki ATCC 30864]